MEKEYKVLEVQKREPWKSEHGIFNSFALKLEGVDGWVSINQKQETIDIQAYDTLHGKLIDATSKSGSHYFKFKKTPKDGGSFGSHSKGASSEDIKYIIQMLEELTLRRESPENPVPREDNLPTEEDLNKPICLDNIPF